MKDYAVVLANDLTEPEKMLDVLKKAAPYLDAVKIGITSSMKPGTGIFAKAKEIMLDKPVLADYKIADVGVLNKNGEWEGTNAKIVKTLAEACDGVYITCHTIVGLSSIHECVEVAHPLGAKVLTLPFMSHKGAGLFFDMPLEKEYVNAELVKYGITNLAKGPLCEKISDLILALGEHFGVDGYIGPANKPKILERYRLFTDKPVWSPGFGRQDETGRTLEQQIKDFAGLLGPNSRMIVGSLIYKAEDPAKAAEDVMRTRDKVISSL